MQSMKSLRTPGGGVAKAVRIASSSAAAGSTGRHASPFFATTRRTLLLSHACGSGSRCSGGVLLSASSSMFDPALTLSARCCWSRPTGPTLRPAPGSTTTTNDMNKNKNSRAPLEEYGMERAFEEPTLRFLFEGNEVDYKQEVREALLSVLPPRPRHFSAVRETESEGGGAEMRTRLLLRSLLQRGVGSYAMQRSMPARLLALYEVTAGAEPALASLLAHHFTAAGMLASHGSPSLRQRYPHWLDQADSGHVLGTTALRELVTDDGPPVNTEARYDYHERCFVLRGTGKFAVVGATLADYVIVSATLTTNKKEHNGVHLFVVPLREEEEKNNDSNSNNKKSEKGGATRSLGSRRADILLEPIRGEGEVFTSSGTGTLYFHHTKIPADHLLGPFCMDENTGKVVYRREVGESATSRAPAAAAAAAAAAFRSVQEKWNQATEAEWSRQSRSTQSTDGETKKTTATRSGAEGNPKGRSEDSSVGRGEVETAVDVLRYRTRLATVAIAMGIMKKQVRDAVQYASQQHVVGPSGYRDYPYLGLQEVQSPLVALLVKGCVYALAWNRYLKEWCSLDAITTPSTASTTTPAALPFVSLLSRRERQTREMRLVGLLALLNETIQVELENFRRRFTHIHASFSSTGAGVGSTTLQLRQEGRNTQDWMREVARRSVVHNIGTTHWGWRVSSVARRFPFLQRFIQNPLYSPRMADLGRHYLFFSHKHYGLKKRLQRSLKIETRRGGAEHAWHDWSTFRHRDIVHCGEAYMEMYLLEVVTAEMTECSGDLRARKLLRDMGWIYALTRQSERLDYYVCTGQMSRNKAVILPPHLDNITTVFASQSRHVAEALCGRWFTSAGEASGAFTSSSSFSLDSRQRRRAASALTDAPCASEAYWTIIGASTHPERGEALTTTREGTEEEDTNSREAQENIREEPEDFDLLHGLGQNTGNPVGGKGNKTSRKSS